MVEKSLNAAPTEPDVAVELRLLVQRAQAGDSSALPGIREVLDRHPEVWQYLGDLSGLTERAWIAVLATGHPVAVESMRRTIAEMKADLAGENPTRLQLMMADQVAANWMELKYLEGASADAGRATLDQSALRLKHLESAQRRYLHAVQMLTMVRALAPGGSAPVGSIKLYDPQMQQQA